MRERGATNDIGRSAMGKVLWRILPLILLSYLCANMDRINVGFAAIQMNVDLGFSATVYGLGGGLFFLGYALFEVPSNMMAMRYGSRTWLARIMITWGLISAGMMFLQTPTQFYVMRFLLGVAEAGFYPGVIYYFASWFPISHRGRAVSRFYVAAPLSSIVMGAASGWLLALDGRADLHGWQWLFLVQGLPSVLVGLAVLRFLPDQPAAVTWLTTAEKRWLETELKREAATIAEPSSHNPLASLRNPIVLLLAASGFLYIGVTNTINLSAPLMLLETTGFDAGRVGYLVGSGGVLGALSMLVGGDYADRRGDRFQNAVWLTLMMAAALALLAAAPSPTVVVIAYLSFAASCNTVAMLCSSGWAQVMHVRELAVGSAAINSLCQLGSFAMPFAWGASRDATGRFTAGLAALTVFLIASAALTWWIRETARTRRLAVAEAAF
jgi:ACS family tartrate transporter-like MFS transporter